MPRGQGSQKGIIATATKSDTQSQCSLRDAPLTQSDIGMSSQGFRTLTWGYKFRSFQASFITLAPSSLADHGRKLRRLQSCLGVYAEIVKGAKCCEVSLCTC